MTVIAGLAETPPLDTTEKKCYIISVEKEMEDITRAYSWVSFIVRLSS